MPNLGVEAAELGAEKAGLAARALGYGGAIDTAEAAVGKVADTVRDTLLDAVNAARKTTGGTQDTVASIGTESAERGTLKLTGRVSSGRREELSNAHFRQTKRTKPPAAEPIKEPIKDPVREASTASTVKDAVAPPGESLTSFKSELTAPAAARPPRPPVWETKFPSDIRGKAAEVPMEASKNPAEWASNIPGLEKHGHAPLLMNPGLLDKLNARIVAVGPSEATFPISVGGYARGANRAELGNLDRVAELLDNEGRRTGRMLAFSDEGIDFKSGLQAGNNTMKADYSRELVRAYPWLKGHDVPSWLGSRVRETTAQGTRDAVNLGDTSWLNQVTKHFADRGVQPTGMALDQGFLRGISFDRPIAIPKGMGPFAQSNNKYNLLFVEGNQAVGVNTLDGIQAVHKAGNPYIDISSLLTPEMAPTQSVIAAIRDLANAKAPSTLAVARNSIKA